VEHPDYRNQWVKAGYDSRMGSAWVCPPPPRHLLRAYHFTTAKHALHDIERGRMKVARFVDLNDPFELLGVNFKKKGVRAAMKEFKTTINETTGLLCFSRNWISPVLWSHYSQKHKGICLGFDISRKRIEDVKYAKERLSPPQDAPKTLTPELKKQLLYTKSHDWQYEQEVRFVVELRDMIHDGGLHFCPFDNDLVVREEFKSH
jgi:hypothetical protein